MVVAGPLVVAGPPVVTVTEGLADETVAANVVVLP
jgi:hypothetical protein